MVHLGHFGIILDIFLTVTTILDHFRVYGTILDHFLSQLNQNSPYFGPFFKTPKRFPTFLLKMSNLEGVFCPNEVILVRNHRIYSDFWVWQPRIGRLKSMCPKLSTGKLWHWAWPIFLPLDIFYGSFVNFCPNNLPLRNIFCGTPCKFLTDPV